MTDGTAPARHHPGEPVSDGHVSGGHVPGEPGLWVMIFGDLMVFSAFFVVYMLAYSKQRDLFEASQQLLDRRLGLVNTILLLTSSWLVARSVDALRRNARGARALLSAGMACGLGFIAVKVFEYKAKVAAGLTLNHDPFFVFYYMLTGVHLVHVLLGLGVLLIVRARFDANGRWTGSVVLAEGGAAFWHLVDLLWIVIFALLYLI